MTHIGGCHSRFRLQVDGCSWSPDGKWIAVRARTPPEKHHKIYTIPSDGGVAQPLTTGDVEQGIPTWSADGTQLVFGDTPPVFGHAEGNEVIHIYDLLRHEYSVLPQSKGLWTSR